MLLLAADENFDNNVLRALRRRSPDVDVVRVQDVGLGGADDVTILRWAAGEGRVLLTHDLATMTRHAYRLVERGEPMAGVLQVPRRLTILQVLDDVLLVIGCSALDDWSGRVRYLPL